MRDDFDCFTDKMVHLSQLLLLVLVCSTKMTGSTAQKKGRPKWSM